VLCLKVESAAGDEGGYSFEGSWTDISATQNSAGCLRTAADLTVSLPSFVFDVFGRETLELTYNDRALSRDSTLSRFKGAIFVPRRCGEVISNVSS
jgi:hypothetical protein